MDFKKKVKEKQIWVSEENLQNIPPILKKEYQLLQQSVQNDDICGALFRLKDIYEISIKLPSILSIITISARMESEQNEGLASRIAFHLNFPDYSPEELTQILDLMLEKSEYRMDERTREKCFSICADACREENYGNGRFVRNLLDHAIMRQADRLIREHQNGTLGKEEACLLTADDFEMIGLKKKPQSRQIGFCAG